MPEEPLNFFIKGQPEYYIKPYWQVVKDEIFNCFPVIEN
jgi:hypothetical protein